MNKKITIKDEQCLACDGDGGWVVRGQSLGIFDIPIPQYVRCDKCKGEGIIRLKTIEYIEKGGKK